METETENTEQEQDDPGSAGESAGTLLRTERERLGLSEKQVADRLHITMHYVRAIETDCYQKLPGIVFARGYIKSYAQLLGLDKDELVELFDTNVSVPKRGPREGRLDGGRSRGGNRLVPWLIIAILAFGSGFLIFWAYNTFFRPAGDAVSALQQPENAPRGMVLRDAGPGFAASLQKLPGSAVTGLRIASLDRLDLPADANLSAGITVNAPEGL
ncbi:MAG: helix-turn-helix domain-containing protein [Gammaproteobacteria bacterium]|nr:helix-turn-helix domain-containing protein [Pseudomonadales bacterium]